MKMPSLFERFALAKSDKNTLSSNERRLLSKVIKKQESITRKDILSWKNARLEASRNDEPRQHLLQVLYDEIMLDAKMTSQINLRIDKSQSASFHLYKDDVIDEDATKILLDTGLYDSLSEAIINAEFYGHTLCEFAYDNNGSIGVDIIPRKHISPETGKFYPDVNGDGELYRDRPDYGTFLIEFYPHKGDLGLLNKAVPYVLMKKFAMSCWSELCEIFGIPPRVMKTQTTDPEMLERAHNMMREVGAAAWFIIDKEEDFEFAQGVNTNGDVYRNFIATCDEHISLLNLGATLGQDTMYGNRSKEDSSAELLDAIVAADKRKIQLCFNKIVIPALETIGVLPPGLRLEFAQAIDTENLWKMVHEASQYYEFDIEWLANTFGMSITGTKSNALASELKAQGIDFFA